jgi:hypothetical protein
MKLVLSLALGLVLAGLGPAVPGVPGGAAAAAAPGSGEGAGRPLVIVLDTSGSMSEDDGAGTIKLAGAQAALSQVIRQQRPGAQIGLWTYPGGAGDCDGGSFAIPVDDLDQRSMITTIRELTADGDTPTAEALRATVDELKLEGYEGATILLISDGLSTCGDPCAVAEEITAEGFDLTVQAAGFLISDEGRDELACIADATDGQVFDATNGDELLDVVTEASRAELTMVVDGIPERTPAGSASRVTVTVTNESAIDIQNARVSLNFANRDGGAQAVVPAVLPPLYRFGNIPAGQSAQHEWLVSYGSRGKTGTATWRAAAWGSNAQPVTRTGTTEVQDLIQDLSDAEGVIAELAGGRIAILGDSFSSGEGGGSYQDGTHQQGNQCHKSPNTYLYPLFGDDDTELIACSGATIGTPGDTSGNVVHGPQTKALADVQEDDGAVDAAFLTIGGNDIGFSGIVLECLYPDTCSADKEWVDEVHRTITDQDSHLAGVYRAVYDVLNREDFVDERGEVAPLFVLAYPQALPERQYAVFCRGFNTEEVEFANDLVERLNARIELAVRRVRRQGYRVDMITPTQETFLPDNTACPRPGAQEFMHSVDIVEGAIGKAHDAVFDFFGGSEAAANQFMHPNALGYQAETNTIIAWSAGYEDDRPEGVAAWRTGPSKNLPDPFNFSTIARLSTPPLPSAGTLTLDAARGEFTDGPADIRGGQPMDIKVEGMAPGSWVTVTIASRRRNIGTILVGEDGTATARVTIPRRTAAGTHTITALGFDSQGEAVVARHEIDVARAIPFWLLPLAALTLLSFLAWWWLGRRYRRREPLALSGTP